MMVSKSTLVLPISAFVIYALLLNVNLQQFFANNASRFSSLERHEARRRQNFYFGIWKRSIPQNGYFIQSEKLKMEEKLILEIRIRLIRLESGRTWTKLQPQNMASRLKKLEKNMEKIYS